MSTPEQYDAIVIGSGEAGKFIAWHLASQGSRVIAIEKDAMGGACPNVACLPSKNIVHSAKVASYFQRGSEFGIVHGDWRVDMDAVRARKRKMVDGLHEVHQNNFKKNGAEFVMGFGSLTGPKTVQVDLNAGGTRALTADKIFIDTGSRATLDPIPGLRESRPLTHIEALELDILPDHLLVLGGGYVGLELAQAIRRFGSRVTVIERNPTLAHREDPDVSEAIQQLFHDEGIDIITSATISSIEGISGANVKLHLTLPTGSSILEGTHLLVATGRTPNTQNMGLELAGVQTTPSGHIQVNDRLETTAPGIWAMGDCAGSPHFTHISFDDFRTVRDNLAGANRSTTNRQVPSCTFTDPELAHVGLSETEARQQGIAYRLTRLPMLAVLRTRTLSETRGFLKALIAPDDRILGFTAFGTGAGELLPAVQLAMANNLPYTAIRNLIISHPTLAEGLVSLFSAVPPN
ncbi:pyruvate/2-oxoglutarate dehydrogenase complex dihydrolipoamide dehydrogenase (E3) component [Edaphobacter aggregans]|uniref:Pyruvate/2-oxoglutarate dehydrogenase complex dihydrolipoamide dehydrogenase (E3) component n=1 Tax=Edaphobacter aggregans TaxID=570835 RepID=A0A3R9NT99_9BACT|nr:FAD-dependent oxidoreductase [Edaphobacter aggregans]RSL16250.1 pyruvate/2-oxoglutarate dehydrogenase complex dihydrolipoamide dehydrogenase (E3) component [Edaphobacter aggregans]